MIDPLNVSIPLGGVKTTIPVLPARDIGVQAIESTIAPNKDGTGHNWNIKFATTEEAEAIDGRPVAPNFPLFHTIALQPREDAKDPQGFRRSIAEACNALFGYEEGSDYTFNAQLVQDAVGKTAVATVYPDEYPKASGNFNTKIRRLKKAA